MALQQKSSGILLVWWFHSSSFSFYAKMACIFFWYWWWLFMRKSWIFIFRKFSFLSSNWKSYFTRTNFSVTGKKTEFIDMNIHVFLIQKLRENEKEEWAILSEIPSRSSILLLYPGCKKLRVTSPLLIFLEGRGENNWVLTILSFI